MACFWCKMRGASLNFKLIMNHHRLIVDPDSWWIQNDDIITMINLTKFSSISWFMIRWEGHREERSQTKTLPILQDNLHQPIKTRFNFISNNLRQNLPGRSSNGRRTTAAGGLSKKQKELLNKENLFRSPCDPTMYWLMMKNGRLRFSFLSPTFSLYDDS